MTPRSTDASRLERCPFCGGDNIDAKCWLRNDGVRGPECADCGATAESIAAWSRRAVPRAGGEERSQAAAIVREHLGDPYEWLARLIEALPRAPVGTLEVEREKWRGIVACLEKALAAKDKLLEEIEGARIELANRAPVDAEWVPTPTGREPRGCAMPGACACPNAPVGVEKEQLRREQSNRRTAWQSRRGGRFARPAVANPKLEALARELVIELSVRFGERDSTNPHQKDVDDLAALLQRVHDAAVEVAAKVCDERAKVNEQREEEYWNRGEIEFSDDQRIAAVAARSCAAAIRAATVREEG